MATATLQLRGSTHLQATLLTRAALLPPGVITPHTARYRLHVAARRAEQCSTSVAHAAAPPNPLHTYSSLPWLSCSFHRPCSPTACGKANTSHATSQSCAPTGAHRSLHCPPQHRHCTQCHCPTAPRLGPRCPASPAAAPPSLSHTSLTLTDTLSCLFLASHRFSSTTSCSRLLSRPSTTGTNALAA
jgi:hypothetical protein